MGELSHVNLDKSRTNGESCSGRKTLHKFMVSLDERLFGELDWRARNGNISIQELLRAVVVPKWIRSEDGAKVKLWSRCRNVTSETLNEDLRALETHSRLCPGPSLS